MFDRCVADAVAAATREAAWASGVARKPRARLGLASILLSGPDYQSGANLVQS
jgi:hypothetical protein